MPLFEETMVRIDVKLGPHPELSDIFPYASPLYLCRMKGLIRNTLCTTVVMCYSKVDLDPPLPWPQTKIVEGVLVVACFLELRRFFSTRVCQIRLATLCHMLRWLVFMITIPPSHDVMHDSSCLQKQLLGDVRYRNTI